MPKRRNFADLLSSSLIWLDWISVPQLRARHMKEEEHGESQKNDRLEDMLNAINSVPAYIHRSAVVFVLAPSVAHADEPSTCQFSSWRRRGWCRLEAVVGCMIGASKFMVLIQSPTQITLFKATDMIYGDAVGNGEFACCKLGHKVEVHGELRDIKCDRDSTGGCCRINISC